MARSLLFKQAEGESKGAAMKLKNGIWALGILLMVTFGAGCGGGGGDASLSSGGGTGITSTFDSPAEMGVGDIMPIELSESSEVTIDFDGVDSSSEFILVLGNASEGGAGSSITTATSASVPVPANDKALYGDELDMTAQEVISHWMRALEMDFSINELPTHSALASKAAVSGSKVVGLGDRRNFRMLNSLSSSTSYTTVTGEVACIGSNIIIYTDARVTDELSDDNIDELCDNFDVDLGNEISLFGDLSDVDGNDKLIAFMSMQVNELGSLGGGIITGYFYAGDLYAQSDSNPVSNYGEIIYTMVPDPAGRWGVAISNSFAMANLLPAVLVHEAQHVISYNQHVFVQGGQAEESWLNEGMSHLTEDLMGLGRENPSRVAMFLANPSVSGLVTSGSPNLLERGASYMFMRFLYEQHSNGSQFLRNLYTSSLSGVENIENAFGGDSGFQVFSQFMARWAVALAVTDRGLTQDARYIYRSRSLMDTGNWGGVCLDCDADDGRGTQLTGMTLSPFFGYHSVALDSSALKFFEITMIPPYIRLSGGENDFGVLIRSN